MPDPSRPEPQVPEAVTPAGRPEPEPSSPAAAAWGSTWLLLSIVLVGMLAGAMAVVFIKSSAPGSAIAAGAAPHRATPGAMSSAPDAAAVTAAPTWTGGVQRSRGRDVAVFELEANHDVSMWGKVVRPVLTVRCIAGTTEVFVLTQSAAAIEGNDGNDGNDGTHTVQIAYDDETDASERWLASADYDALFAANGMGAVRRIAAARTMRFGFTPYNAAPVVAHFNVAGFRSVTGTLARTCRWK